MRYPGPILKDLAPQFEDISVSAFLRFLEKDSAADSLKCSRLTAVSLARAILLTKDVHVSEDETLPDDVIF